jgi:hypothetical protein
MRKSYDDYSFLPVDALSQKKKKEKSMVQRGGAQAGNDDGPTELRRSEFREGEAVGICGGRILEN